MNKAASKEFRKTLEEFIAKWLAGAKTYQGAPAPTGDAVKACADAAWLVYEIEERHEEQRQLAMGAYLSAIGGAGEDLTTEE